MGRRAARPADLEVGGLDLALTPSSPPRPTPTGAAATSLTASPRASASTSPSG
jgi:hypothetical protein